MESKKYQLNKADGSRILLGLFMAVGGAFLTYMAELIPNVDFGAYTAIVVAVASVLVNSGRKFLKDYTKKEEVIE